MTERAERLKKQLLGIYDRNPFVALLEMKIEELGEGEVVLSMPINHALTNLFGMAHGGALASLADTAMGVACGTLGKKVMTLDMNLNFIRGANQDEIVRSRAKVIHNGKSTIVVENELLDGAGNLLNKARGTFFVVGQFESD